MVHPAHYKQQLIHLDPSAKYRCHDKFKNSKMLRGCSFIKVQIHFSKTELSSFLTDQ